MDEPGTEHFFWIIPGETWPFKRRQSTWRMTEAEARARYGEAAEKVEGSREVRHGGAQHADHLYPPRGGRK